MAQAAKNYIPYVYNDKPMQIDEFQRYCNDMDMKDRNWVNQFEWHVAKVTDAWQPAEGKQIYFDCEFSDTIFRRSNDKERDQKVAWDFFTSDAYWKEKIIENNKNYVKIGHEYRPDTKLSLIRWKTGTIAANKITLNNETKKCFKKAKLSHTFVYKKLLFLFNQLNKQRGELKQAAEQYRKEHKIAKEHAVVFSTAFNVKFPETKLNINRSYFVKQNYIKTLQ